MTSGYSDFVVFMLLFMAFFAIMGIPTIMFIASVVNHFKRHH